MTDQDVQQRLADALSTLPGGPLAAPPGLVGTIARRRRRQGIGLVAAAVVVGVSAASLIALRPAPAPQPAAAPFDHEACTGPTGFGGSIDLRPLADGVVPTRSKAEVLAFLAPLAPVGDPGPRVTDVYPAMVLDPQAGSLGLGSPTEHRLMWVLDQLRPMAPVNGYGPGLLEELHRSLTLVDDQQLALGSQPSCDLSGDLVGAMVDSPPFNPLPYVRPVFNGQRVPYGPLEPGARFTIWRLLGAKGTDLLVRTASCGQTVQVQETKDVVLIRTVEGPGARLCPQTTGESWIRLSAPLGDRLLLHGAS
jgi:hypothetical protein